MERATLPQDLHLAGPTVYEAVFPLASESEARARARHSGDGGRVPSAEVIAEHQKSCDDIGDGHSHKTQRIRGPASVVAGKPPRCRNGQIDRNVRWRRDGRPVDA